MVENDGVESITKNTSINPKNGKTPDFSSASFILEIPTIISFDPNKKTPSKPNCLRQGFRYHSYAC